MISIIDVGNFSTKYCYKDGSKIKANSFPSILHPYKPLEDEADMIRVQYNDLDYYVGESVKNFYFGRQEQMYFGNTRKGHHEAQIRLIFALYNIYEETGQKQFDLVITSPYKSLASDKAYFSTHFLGSRSAKIGDKTFDFEITNLVMAAEGLGSTAYIKDKNCVVIDAGSMTTNILHLINGTISKNDSHTINGGTIMNDPFQIANLFIKTKSDVDYSYPIICTGGRSEEIQEVLKKLGYTNVNSVKDKDHPSYYANSVGLIKKFGTKFEEIFS